MTLYTPQGLQQQSQSFDPFPKGDYNLMITETKDGPFSDGAGHKLDLTLTVADGPHRGRKMFDLIALQHNNPDWARDTQARLDAICQVAGLASIQAWSQLLNVCFRAKVFIEKSSDEAYSDKNKIDMILGPAIPEANTGMPGAAPGQMAAPGAAPPGGQMQMQMAPPGQQPPAPAAPGMTPPPGPTPGAAPQMSAPGAPPPPAPAPDPVPPGGGAVAMVPMVLGDGHTYMCATVNGIALQPGQPGYVQPTLVPADNLGLTDDDIPF